MKIDLFFKQLFCKHDYHKTGFTQEIENNVRYSVRFYTCRKCRKTVEVDGRYDPYERRMQKHESVND